MSVLKSRWNADHASSLSTLDQLVYRSNLLGADRSIVNYGGGNTSSKGRGVDHRGRDIDVMWIKGSGSDLQTADCSAFPALRLEEIREVASEQEMSDEEM